MPSHEEKRKAIRAYKEKEEIGGLYRFRNNVNGWQSPLLCTPNMEGKKNMLQFSQKTGTCPENALAEQWRQFPPDAFELVEVERLKRKPEQTNVEFREELAALLELMGGQEA